MNISIYMDYVPITKLIRLLYYLLQMKDYCMECLQVNNAITRLKRYRDIKEENWVVFSKCTKCWERKPLTKEYYNKANNKIWLSADCKKCIAERTKEYYKKHTTERKQYAKKYREEHIEYYQQNKKEYRDKNREKLKEYHREYVNKNRDTIVLKRKEYYERTKQDHIKRAKQHIQKFNDRTKINLRTARFIKRNNLRPKQCPICWSDRNIQAHHTNYNERNNIVFCCKRCHSKIHTWAIQCPETINLLECKK